MSELPVSNNALLASLAIIKANWDTANETYIDNFLAFYLDAAKASSPASITPAAAKTYIAAQYGIRVPDGVLATLSKRAASKGFGRREYGSFIPSPDRMEKLPDIGRQKAKYLRAQAALVNEMRDFAAKTFSVNLDKDQAEEALLSHVEEYSAFLLASVVNGDQYRTVDPNSTSRDVDYVVSSFIAHVVTNNPTAFDQLEAVVKGSMLAVSLYLPNASEVGRRFKDTTLYLDTRVLIRALGYEGPEGYEAASDLLKMCRSAGARIACFEHNVGEVDGILNRAARKTSPRSESASRPRLTDEYFASSNLGPSDIMLLADRIEEDIAQLGIEIEAKPPMTSSLSIDEIELQHLIEDSMSYISPDAVIHDVDSLAAIHRLRNGRRGPKLETCGALFVTANGSLARLGDRYFTKEGEHQWPVVVTDHHLATLVWLKNPHTAPSLPRRQILADCFAALEPSAKLWNQYLLQIQKIKDSEGFSERDLMVLRYSTEAQRELMDRTLGNPDRVSTDTVVELLGDVKDHFVAPIKREFEQAKATTERAEEQLMVANSQLAARYGQLDTERAARAKAEKDFSDLKAKMLALESDAERVKALEASAAVREAADQLLQRRITGLAKGIAVGAQILVLCIIGAIFVFGVLSLAIQLLSPENFSGVPTWLKILAPICAGVLALGGFVTLMLGGNIRDLAQQMRKKITLKIDTRLRAVFRLGAPSQEPHDAT